MNLQEIKDKAAAGEALTPLERAYFIQHDAAALAAFMIANNPGNVNHSLRQMGYDHLGFEPKPQALAAQLDKFIQRKDHQAFGQVINGFHLITDGLSDEEISALKTVSFNA
jgi:hypothetical protein